MIYGPWVTSVVGIPILAVKSTDDGETVYIAKEKTCVKMVTTSGICKHFYGEID